MRINKPIIGVTSSYEKTEELDRIFLPSNYLDTVRYFGGIPLLIPTKATAEEVAFLLEQCDGLMLTGGNDIAPALYGERILNDTVVPAPERDELELKLCRLAADCKMPILGICRGMQIMNVAFGGSLYQDIPSQIPSKVSHSMDKPYHRTWHDCVMTSDAPLAAGIIIQVNSHHHQSVKEAAAGFSVMGQCSDGVIEAIWNPREPFVWGIQWHPERIWDIEPTSAQIFEAFIDACK